MPAALIGLPPTFDRHEIALKITIISGLAIPNHHDYESSYGHRHSQLPTLRIELAVEHLQQCCYDALSVPTPLSYSHKNRLNLSSTTEEIHACWQEFYATEDEFALMQDDWFKREDGISRLPQFEKVAAPNDLVFKHVRYHHLIAALLERDPQVRFITVVRDPRATINSFLNSAEFDPAWSRADQWRSASKKNQDRSEEFYGYERWKEAARQFMTAEKKFPDRVRLVCYRELLGDTESAIRNLFEFSELEFGEATRNFLVDSQTRSSGDYGVYRQKTDDLGWLGQLEENIVEAIESDLKSVKNQDLLRFVDDTSAASEL